MSAHRHRGWRHPDGPMGALALQAEPAEAGLDAARLARIDRHFERYVDDGRLAGWQLVIPRGGRVAHVACRGMRDLEAGLPVCADTIWRIYSMTKPVTSVAAMMLYEEGAFELKDPVAKFIPAFRDARVWAGGTQLKPETRPALEPMRMWHLLTHTSGLTYGFHWAHPLDGIYRDHGYEFGFRKGLDLAQCVDEIATFPLLFEPGTEWNYSVSTDVLGRVVEVLSGQSLDVFFAERILQPLRMTETSFGPADPERLAEVYSRDPDSGELVVNARLGPAALRR